MVQLKDYSAKESKRKEPMELDDALMILTEIATGTEEREAICLVKESIYGLQYEADTYRHMYEGVQKRIVMYRDMASKPDLPYPTKKEMEASR